MVICLSSIRMNMSATIMHKFNADVDPATQIPLNVGQDVWTGEIIKKWSDGADPSVSPTLYENTKCLVESIVSSGTRYSASDQEFGSLYQDIEYIEISFPKSNTLTKSDRITNIKDSRGDMIYLDYESDPLNPKPTVFNIEGITKIFNPFGEWIESKVLASRAD